MSSDFERDRSVDRLLRGAPDAALPPASSPCPDAEQLAAWAEGALEASEAGLVDAHLADCRRCQTILAAFASTDGATVRPQTADGVALPWRQRAVVRWALPLAGAAAAAAAALAFWITTPRQTTPPAAAVRQSAKLERAEPTLPHSEPFPQPATAAPNPAAPPAARTTRVPKEAIAGQGGRSDQTTSSALQKGLVSERLERREVARSARNSSIGGANSLDGRSHITPTVDAVSEAKATSADPVQFASPERSVGPSKAAAPATARSVAERRDAGRTTAPAQVRWRVFKDGRVERSVTNGTSWEPVSIDPGLAIVTGVAPDANVCWLVGSHGVVLRTVDRGDHFARVDVQDAADLTGVLAVDDLRATVTASDGRAFSTIDGGASWRPGTL